MIFVPSRTSSKLQFADGSPPFCLSIRLNPVKALKLPVISFSWTAALSLEMSNLRFNRLRARISRVILSYTDLYRWARTMRSLTPVHERRVRQAGRDPPPLCAATACERHESTDSVRYAGPARRHELDAQDGRFARTRARCI